MERGYLLDVRCPQLGQALPKTPDSYVATLMFGGPMSANDEHLPGIATELRWLEQNMNSSTPFVGVCLGAQILARVLGASVALHPEGFVEIGYVPIEPTDDGASYFASPLDQVFQWHKEGFDAPAGTVALAHGKAAFENQFFRYGDLAYGIQFHPEVTLQMLNRWTIGAAHMLELPGAMARDDQLEGHRLHDPALDTWSNAFVDHIVSLSGRRGTIKDRSAA